MVQLGITDEQHAERVITVHSMSKTDCLAGARIAIVEIRDAALRQRFQEVNTRVVSLDRVGRIEVKNC
jgi:aspartate/methionine/tyrosine aminotransferase